MCRDSPRHKPLSLLTGPGTLWVAVGVRVVRERGLA
jgi:hypothetical protein